MRELKGSEAALAIHRELNSTASDYPRDASVPALFEACAGRRGSATAIVDGDRRISYRRLDRLANGLAADLVARGLGPGTAVGVCLRRSAGMIAALLAVLKCGCSYLPFDPGWPDEHLRGLFAGAGCGWVLTDQAAALARRFGTCQVVPVREEEIEPAGVGPAVRVTAGDIAYINFTSGSTGRPKGVPIRHRSIARLVFGARYAPLGDSGRLLQLAPVTFDAATFEIWAALLNGGTCVLYPRQFLRLSLLGELLREHGITVLFLTTALFNAVIDEAPETLASVQTILTGGESHSIRHMARALRTYGPGRLVNVYGPTEATTFATYYPVNELAEDASTVPIGRPIQNTRLYIVAGGTLCEPGRSGELWLAGDGLSPGYLGMPELTAERFTECTIGGTAERLYRTGDYGYLLPSGDVVFQGRKDNQVKVNGHRIELGEIAHHLDSQHGVRQSHVTLSARDGSVVAFVVASDASCTAGFLREQLLARLPAYMVPARIYLCEALPLSATGKVDRQALLAAHDSPGSPAPAAASASRQAAAADAGSHRAAGPSE